MRMEDMIMISVDDHIIEPPDLFVKHVAAKYRDRAPRVFRYENGEERWVIEGKRIPTPTASALSGRKREELGNEATRYDQLRRGHYDVHARIDDMNANGTLASLCFPTLPGFCGELFLKGEDRGLMHALVQAYNDWMVEDWCGAYPGRFIPMTFTAFWDPDLAVAEINRMAKRGVRVISLPEAPSNFGMPSIHRDYWDPIFGAIVDADMTVAIHIGSSGTLRFPTPDTPVDWTMTMVNIAVADTLMDFVYSPVLKKFPDIRFAMSEGCIGWVPYLMERADAEYDQHRYWTHLDFGDQKPSDLMRKHFLYCFHSDKIGLKLRHEVGIERITWECDYPHADSTWPRSPERLWEEIGNLPEHEIELITHKNAMDYFRWDPFAHIDKKDSTVGALRARATHVDVAPTSMGETNRKPVATGPGKALTLGDLGRLMQEMDGDLGPVREEVQLA